MLDQAIAVLEAYDYRVDTVLHITRDILDDDLTPTEYKRRYRVIEKIIGECLLDGKETSNKTFEMTFKYIALNTVKAVLNEENLTLKDVMVDAIQRTRSFLEKNSYVEILDQKKEEDDTPKRVTKYDKAISIYRNHYDKEKNNSKEVKKIIETELDVSDASAASMFYKVKKEHPL